MVFCLLVAQKCFLSFLPADRPHEQAATYNMDFPSPTSTPPFQFAVTNEVAISIGRDGLGENRDCLQYHGIQGAANEARKTIEAVLKRTHQSRDDTKELYGTPSKKFKRLAIKLSAKNDLASPKQATPLGRSIYDTLARMGEKKSPSSVSDEGRIRRAEIAAILSQASAVAFAMGTSTIGEKSLVPSMSRRRFQRRNSFVIHRDKGGFPQFGIISSGDAPEIGHLPALDAANHLRGDIFPLLGLSKKETESILPSIGIPLPATAGKECSYE